jgi:hypothetical protein
MNINFDQIIEKANQRKNALVALQSRVQALPEILKDLEELRQWGVALEFEIRALDVEGQQLVGEYKLQADRTSVV